MSTLAEPPISVTVNIPDAGILGWLTAGSSVILAIITLAYVVLTQRLLRQAEAVEANRRKREAASQASAISAWVSKAEVLGNAARLELSARNPTDQAIYDLRVAIFDSASGLLVDGMFDSRTLGPEEAASIDTTVQLPRTASGNLRTSVSFTDGQGVSWRRTETGELRSHPAGVT